MATVNRRFENHFGIDYKSDDLTRNERYASTLLNCQNRKSGAIELRPGFQIHGDTQGGMGLVAYNRTNPDTGKEVPELVCFGKNPFKAEFSTLTVQYVGIKAPVMVSVFFDPASSQYRCQILEEAAIVLDMALGVGYDELLPVTVGALQSAIAALPGFSASVSGSTSTPAAFLEIVRDYDLLGAEGPLQVSAAYWKAINTPVPDPFAIAYANRNSEDFENASSTQINNCLYVGNGYDHTHKYDGQNFYRAGVPTPYLANAFVIPAVGVVNGDHYRYAVQFTQVDAVGQYDEGNLIYSNELLSVALSQVQLDVGTVPANSGFNTNCALVTGDQTFLSTIVVDNGSGGAHTLKVGDTAYFHDGYSGKYVERRVTAATPTSITVDGVPVTVKDNAVISNNLRITIWRSVDSGSTPTGYYLLEEIPNNSFVTTQTYIDNTADESLGPALVVPATDRSAPPKASYLASFKNRLVVTGTRTYAPPPLSGATVTTGVQSVTLELSPNTVSLSDIDGPEYFPADGATSFECISEAGDVNSGIAEHNNVLNVFKRDRSIFVVSANEDGNITSVEQLPGNVGCIAHATIHRASGYLYFVDGTKGPQKMVGGQKPQPLGEIAAGKEVYGRIEPVFDQRGVTGERRLNFVKAVAVNHRASDKYILFLPAETTTGDGDKYANANSRIFAYDYSRDAWYEWSNMNMMAGAATVGDRLYWQERRLSKISDAVTCYLYRQHRLNDAWDYEDNDQPITWEYGGAWDALSHPSVLKRWLWLKLYSMEETRNNSFSIPVRTEVNFIRDVTKSSFTFTGTGGGYSVDAYSTDAYGSPQETNAEHKLGGGRFTVMRVVFGGTTHQQNCIINGWETEVETPYKLQIKE